VQQKEKEDDGEKESNDQKDEEDETSTKTTLTEETKKEVLIQWQFDVAYVRASTAVHGGTEGSADALIKVEDTIAAQNGLDHSSRSRITKSAEASWQRTNVLFGLLAQ
jgi:hypothetical protein